MGKAWKCHTVGYIVGHVGAMPLAGNFKPKWLGTV